MEHVQISHAHDCIYQNHLNFEMMETDYKLSYYTIFSDHLNQDGDRVLFSSRSGQALTVSAKVYDCLIKNDFSSLPEQILSTLLTQQMLVNIKANELVEIIEENKKTIAADETLYEVIQPSAMCQLGCPYCGQEHKKKNLPSNLYSNLIDRIEKKLGRKKYRNLSIGWFGGEPLVGLREMRDLTGLLKDVALKNGLNYNAKIVTNGLSLKENIFDLLVKELAVNSIEVTLDGIAPFHDQRRYLKEGGASFKIIFKNLLKIFNKPDFYDYKCNISIRCNVDKDNVEGVLPLLKLLADHKLQNKISYFYPIGVYSWGGNDAHKNSFTKEEFGQLEIEWLIEMIKLGFNVGLLPQRVKKVCLSVSPDSEMYDAYGNIFNCTEVSYTSFYENTSYVLGNLKQSSEKLDVMRPLMNWNDLILNNEFQCSTCKMLPVCGGGCPKSWHESMPACPSNKFNIKEKLALSYVLTKMDITEV